MVDQRRRNRQLAVFLAGLLALNFPLLGLVDAIRLPGGVPLDAALSVRAPGSA